MTGIGYGPIGANGIGGTTGGIGVGGIGVGPIGGSTGHTPTPSSVGDSYQIQVSATVADSYRVHVAPTIGSSYSIALASTLQAAHNIEVAARISDAYHVYVSSARQGAYHIRPGTIAVEDSYRILVRSVLEGQYGISFHASLVGAYEICRGILDHTLQYSSEYRYRQDFVIPLHFYDSTKYNYVFGQTDTSSGPCLTLYRCEGTNTQYELYVGKNCRADFGDLYFYDTYLGRRMPHRLWRLRYDAEKQAEAVDVSIVRENSTLYSSLSVRLYYGLDRADPSPAWPLNTWPTPGFIPFMVCNFPCNWGALTPNYSYLPTGAYNIQVGQPAIGRYQIHLAKIMEG